MLYEARVVMEPVDAPAEAVYGFARDVQQLPRWASGLATGVEQRDGRWFTRSPMGEVEVAFAAVNTLGVLDHDVKLPDGTLVHNAFRVTPCGSGSVLTFTVLRLPGTSPDAFEADVAHVRRDLQALRRLVEQRGAA